MLMWCCKLKYTIHVLYPWLFKKFQNGFCLFEHTLDMLNLMYDILIGQPLSGFWMIWLTFDILQDVLSIQLESTHMDAEWNRCFDSKKSHTSLPVLLNRQYVDMHWSESAYNFSSLLVESVENLIRSMRRLPQIVNALTSSISMVLRTLPVLVDPPV